MSATLHDYVLVKVTTCCDNLESVTNKLDFSHKEFKEYVNHLNYMIDNGFIYFLNISKVTEGYYEILICY